MGKTELVKGSTEVILLSLLDEKDMYGYELAQMIENHSKGFLRFKEGTLYSALKKLGMQGLVESYWQYMVSATSYREDEEFGYVYKLEQISNQEKYQLRGMGRIK